MQDITSPEEEVYCRVRNADEVAENANSFIVEYFFKCVSSGVMIDRNYLEIFGFIGDKLGGLAWFIKMFCDWLKIMGFSSVSLHLPT